MCIHCTSRSAEPQAAEPDRTVRGFAVGVCLVLIKGYRYCISPLFPPCCRYTPTCSQYAVDAVSRYGAVKGMWLALCRILRCHPFVRGGYDPVK